MVNYDSSQIKVLEWLEPVRHRPWMYIGSTDVRGLHHMVWEIVDNAVDEAMAGFCKNILVVMQEDGYVTISDDWRWLPVDIHQKTGKSWVETILTILHAWGKFEKWVYKVSWGLHWVWASVVNALSEHLIVKVYKNWKIYKQEFKRWITATELEIIWETERVWTTVSFKADDTIFETTKYTPWTILQRLKQSAYLTPSVSFTFMNELTWDKQRFDFEWGLNAWLKNMTSWIESISDIFSIQWETDNLLLEVSAKYVNTQSENLLSFVNNITTPDWWTHVVGFKNWLLKAINETANSRQMIDKKVWEFQLWDILEWLYAIISIKIPEPQFEGQTKWRLWNSYVKWAVEKASYEYFSNFFAQNEKIFDNIFEKINLSARARVAARLARETVLRKTSMLAWVLPWKLTECWSKKRENTELFIVEWDSAGWTAKSGRNSFFQAILPLRWKILNTENIHVDKLLQSEMIKNLVLAIWAWIKDSFDLTKLRYEKIIIMTDADVDWAHIRTLLLTFFFRYMRPLIENGNLYIAVSPLYKIYTKSKFVYIYPLGEVEDLSTLKKNNWFSEGAEVQRYKGLWEMNAEQLWETTMNPETRKLLQVSVEDAEASDRLFRILMWDDVASRKNFILTHAKNTKELDI